MGFFGSNLRPLSKRKGFFRATPIASSAVVDLIVDLSPHTLLRASTGFNGTWTDIMSGRVFSGSAPSRISSSELNGAQVLRFNGTTSQLISQDPPSTWRFLHNGTGQETYAILVPRRPGAGGGGGIFTTVNSYAGTGIGYAHFAQNQPDFNIFGVMAGSGSRIWDSQARGYYHLGVPIVVGSFYKEGSIPECRNIVDMFNAMSGSTSFPPTSVDPNFTLTIGAYANNGTKNQFDVAEIMIFDRELLPAERATINTYAISTYNTYNPNTPRYGVFGFSATNYFSCEDVQGEPGVASGFGGCALIRVDALQGATFRAITDMFNVTALTGWQAYVNNNVLTFGAVNGSGVHTTAPTYTYVANDVGKWDLVVWQHEGTSLKLWRAREQQGTSTAITGYTSASIVSQRIGNRPNGTTGGQNEATGITIAAVQSWQGILSTGSIANIYDAVKRTGTLPVVSGSTHLWEVVNNVGNLTQLTDLVGSATMILSGTLTLRNPIAGDPWTF